VRKCPAMVVIANGPIYVISIVNVRNRRTKMEFKDFEDYEAIGGGRGNNLREACASAIDALVEKESFQEVMEREIELCEVPVEYENYFRDGFRVGMAFMLGMTASEQVKTVVSKKFGRKSKIRRHPVRRVLAKVFGITPFDILNDI
jgi:hypothetical protein